MMRASSLFDRPEAQTTSLVNIHHRMTCCMQTSQQIFMARFANGSPGRVGSCAAAVFVPCSLTSSLGMRMQR